MHVIAQPDATGSATPQVEIKPAKMEPIDILVMGQDTRNGAKNAEIGGGADELVDEHQADTTIVVQIAADRSYINLVSIPRDSLIDQPSCTMSNGTVMRGRRNVMFNSVFANAYQMGGDLTSAANCAVHTVNSLTGMTISQFVVVDFAGMSEMIDALGGVDVCLPEDVNDRYSGLVASKGVNHFDGVHATQYARTRHGLGDGSDLMRTTRQQYLIKRLVSTALDKLKNDPLGQSNELYQFALTALNSVSMSEGLADVSTLVSLAMTMLDFDVNHIYSQTIPVVTAPEDPNRVVWADEAEDVWAKLKSHQPLVDEGTVEPTPTPTPSEETPVPDPSGSATTYQWEPTETPTPTPSETRKKTTAEMSVAERISYYTEQGGSYDAVLQVITMPSGLIIDPLSDGRVTKDGTVIDRNTGYPVGIAYTYLTATYCPSLL